MMTKSAIKAVTQPGHDPLEYILLRMNKGHIAIMNAGESALLAVLTGDDMGDLIPEMKKVSRNIEEFV